MHSQSEFGNDKGLYKGLNLNTVCSNPFLYTILVVTRYTALIL